MLKFQLRHVVAYATSHKDSLKKAVEEFFEKKPIDPQMENIEAITGLFNEWYIFNFKPKTGTTFIADYFLKNPDGFSKELMEELCQIVETQHFDMFEIQSLKRGEWIKVYGLLSGETYSVSEYNGSLRAPERGTFWGRIAKVENKYIFVGSNPVYLPVSTSPRLKKFYSENKQEQFTPKHVLPILLPHKTKPSITQQPKLTQKELKNKRKDIEKKYNKLQAKYGFSISLEAILSFVNNENYKTNFADFTTDLVKLGIPERAAFISSELFNDIWNFFPHKKLKGKSPYEMR